MERIFELEDLHDKQKELEIRKDEYFEGDDNPHYGDRGYQDICEQLDAVSEQINEIENGFDENPDVLNPEIFEIEDINAENPYYDNAQDFEID